jgi:hypothetical protein
MSVRDYAVLYIGSKPDGGGDRGVIGGGNAITTTAEHKIDGAEHQTADDLTRLNATATEHGLLPRLSGDAGDHLGGTGAWVPDQWKQPCRVATTGDVDTANALNAGDSIDDVTLAAGDRVLVHMQTDPAENGTYVAGVVPVRAADMDASDEVEGALVHVIDGTLYGGTTWRTTNTAPPAIGVDDILWEQLATSGAAVDVALVTVGAAGATETIDVSAARTYDVTLTADCTLSLTGAVDNEAWFVTLMLRQDGTGGWEATWPVEVVWPGGSPPVLSAVPGAIDVFVLFSVNGGNDWFGFPTGSTSSALVADLDDLTDVTLTAPSEGQQLAYRSGFWVNETPPTARWELVVDDGGSGPAGVLASEYVEMTTQRTTTSASLEDITGATADITTTREAHIWASLTCHVSASAACDLGLAISFDGTDHDISDAHLTTTDEGNVTIVHRTTTLLPAGTYTIKGRFRRSSGGGTPAVDRADLLVTSTGTQGPTLITTDDEDDFLYAEV